MTFWLLPVKGSHYGQVYPKIDAQSDLVGPKASQRSVEVTIRCPDLQNEKKTISRGGLDVTRRRRPQILP
ncbi:unnamed protein product [Gongylonema pulchrum]|uniref:Uncharacterized protein n=1 Tax=Gongylonema pulchrum TaxID=637853 RepID=A0A183CWJ2_9BILA|nr:unnamed protein product [Gongylonema pulchrum]